MLHDDTNVGCLALIIIFFFLLGISFLACAALFWVVCWAFGWVFSWKIALGIWIVLAVLRGIFSVTIKE